ncbi:MAG: ABC transporter ATP-binding protein [Thermoplasmata archaeon]|uniref:ABC transporter ATP-binding protein n=1 Tax=Candidatus Sysuiplasma superficiale TaxID=2823368 RepID=A0A8J7YNX6_9ARCH|nr:ABC transporter ATP-binding protein [Candidatus Sysuiplasma superficiale]
MIGSVADDRTAAKDTSAPVIAVDNLSVNFDTDDGVVKALDRINLNLRSGETLGILGESGSGKTTLANAIISMLPENASVSGEVRFMGETVASPDFSGKSSVHLKRKQRKILSEKLSRIRWKGISIVFQGSMNAFNPAYTIRKQISEVFRFHTDLDEDAISQKVLEAVRHAGLNPAVLDSFPHELSGGMKQRAVIAMALALKPRLVIADEPTTGLDVITQARIISELKELRKTEIESMIVISHDIGVIAQLADRIAVMYAGRIMEIGSIEDIYVRSANPYTRALLDSYPSLAKAREPIIGIPGSPPDPIAETKGCKFASRCLYAQQVCREEDPPAVMVSENHYSLCHFASDFVSGKLKASMSSSRLIESFHSFKPTRSYDIIKTENLSKYFDLRGTLFGSVFSRSSEGRLVRAVDHISVEIGRNEIFAIVGESGSGKTTIGKTLLGLLKPTAGKILYYPVNSSSPVEARQESRAIAGASENLPSDLQVNGPLDIGALKESSVSYELFRRQTQMIFQDPYDSLDPKMTIFDIVQEPVLAHKVSRNPNEIVRLVSLALRTVNLTPPENYLERFPHELSGGERQRVAAARALVLRPDMLIADEPISMLDVSLRAGFMNLLLKLRSEFGITIIYITHDIASARYLADRILVMYLGVAVEVGETEEVIRNPLHPYTIALLQAVPIPAPNWNPGNLQIEGEIGSAINVPKGCRFYLRCPYRAEICRDTPPPVQGTGSHWYLCHFDHNQILEMRRNKFND